MTIPDPAVRPPPSASVWRLAWRVSQHKPRQFWLGFWCFVGFFGLPALTGWLLGRAFDTLEASRPVATAQLAGMLAAAEVARMALLYWGAIWFMQAWEHMRGLLRGNMLIGQLASGGPESGRPVASPAAATARFRDDTEDVAWFVDSWVDAAGAGVFAVIALSVLLTVDVAATAVLLIPMAAVGLVATGLGRRLQRLHRVDRHAAEDVSALLGDAMAAPVTIEVNRAAPAVLGRLKTVLDHRLATVVRARVAQDAIRSFSQSTADIGLGLVLLVVIGSLRSGRFGVGDIALFLSYGGALGFGPRTVGMLLARRQQVEVAFDEMSRLVADDAPANLVIHRAFPFERDECGEAPQVRPEPVRLVRLEATGLTVAYPDGNGIAGVDLTLDRGTLTVVTGPVGAGKTTLLRALLGLIDRTRAEVDGEVRWNGAIITDRAAFFVPPRSAWVPQLPQLLSDSLADNILLGREADGLLDQALASAAVGGDVAAMVDGVQTVIGPRGVRLSGGQRQRVAAARALAAGADLLVVDDLSSALDVETEVALWENVAALGATVLAVSHRQVAFDRADQILRLEGGRLAGP